MNKFAKVAMNITAVAISFAAVSTAWSDIEVRFNAPKAPPSIGVGGGDARIRYVPGKIKTVDFAIVDLNGKSTKAVVVTFNEGQLPSGDQGNDEIWFSGDDLSIGLSLIGAIGKPISVHYTGSFKVNGMGEPKL